MLWASNIAAPYRVPMWAALAQRFDLHIVLMAQSMPNRAWRASDLLDGFEATVVNAPAIHLAEDIQLYFPNRRLYEVATSDFDVLVVDGWESPSYQFLLWQAKRRGKRVVCFYQSTLESHRFRRGPIAWVRRQMCRNADIVVTSGKSSAAAVRADGVPPSRIREAFNPIDTAAFQRVIAVRHVATAGHTFVFAGQLIERKNPKTVIEAFARMRDDHDSLIVIGDGPLCSSLEGLVANRRLEHCVEFRGQLSQAEVAEVFGKTGNTLVMPSTREVYGLVAAEALASGMHCIVSGRAGVTSVITGMRGVYVSGTGVDSVERTMRDSRNDWRGRIAEPEVVDLSAEAFADIFANALSA